MLMERRQNLKRSSRGLAALLAAVLIAPGSASAQVNIAGKTVSIIVGFGSGGGYDLWARTLARHIGRYFRDFAEEVRRHKLDLEPKSGKELAALARNIYDTPQGIVEKVTGLIR
jgi:hypothetical protein